MRIEGKFRLQRRGIQNSHHAACAVNAKFDPTIKFVNSGKQATRRQHVCGVFSVGVTNIATRPRAGAICAIAVNQREASPVWLDDRNQSTLKVVILHLQLLAIDHSPSNSF
ncbi:MAG: hypothetical protein IIA02_08010 [Proteobacteria bacterium]|nr:hypothetical protein [Pseudomonadota bacterium]